MPVSYQKLGLEDFLEAKLKEGLQAVGTEQGSLMLLNERKGILEIVKRNGLPFDVKKKHRQFGIGEGIAGWVLKNRQARLNHDVTKDELFKKPVGKLNFRSLLTVPILSEGRGIGIICADHIDRGKFKEEHQKKLEKIAEEIAIAIKELAVETFINHSKQLKRLETLHTVGQELSRLTFATPDQLPKLLEKIAKEAERVLEADLVTLYRYYAAKNEFVTPPARSGELFFPQYMVATIHPEDVPVGIIRLGKTHYSPDAFNDTVMRARATLPADDGLPERPSFVDREGIQSSAGVLLKAANNEAVGVMFVNYRLFHPFPAEEKHVIETFATYAALAIHRARRVQEVIEAQKAALLQSSASFAHRLRNVLPVISYWVKQARETVSRETSEYLEVALGETSRAQKIVSGFDDFARAESFDLPNLISGVRLLENLGEIAKRYLPLEKGRLRVDEGAAGYTVKVNLDRLSEDIGAMIHDSIRHRPKGLEVTLTCEPADIADIRRVGLKNTDKKYLKLIYKDNGPGVSPEIKKRIFEPFYTASGGSGLGLAIAMHNARVHGGIMVENGRSKGVQFELFLPCEEATNGLKKKPEDSVDRRG